MSQGDERPLGEPTAEDRPACSHAVDCSVENPRRVVDVKRRAIGLHRPVTGPRRPVRLSSTGPGLRGASVYRRFRRLSPVSTAAKTTDENLYSLMHNDKNCNLVKSGDPAFGRVCSPVPDEGSEKAQMTLTSTPTSRWVQ